MAIRWNALTSREIDSHKLREFLPRPFLYKVCIMFDLRLVVPAVHTYMLLQNIPRALWKYIRGT